MNTTYEAHMHGRPIGIDDEGRPNCCGVPILFVTVVQAAEWAKKHQEEWGNRQWPWGYGVRRTTLREETTMHYRQEVEDL